jgi:hypothetical protein
MFLKPHSKGKLNSFKLVILIDFIKRKITKNNAIIIITKFVNLIISNILNFRFTIYEN